MSNYSNGRMEMEKAALGGYRVLSHDSDDQGQFTEVVAECYRLDNARMAAAAPDLLAALQAVEPYLFSISESLHKQARAAIAKATGA